jgi:NIMA-interacting peptidyl-prolyl cis-trans isomerase 4
MAPKNNAKGAAKGKGKDADDKGKGKGAVKGAQTIQVRHILVRDPHPVCMDSI